MDGTGVTFDSNSLQTSSIITQDIDHHGGPTRTSPIYGIAHGNRSVSPFTNYASKPITISGQLVADSIAELDVLIDTFKGYFNYDGNLDIVYNGGTRRYVCQPQTPDVRRPGGLTSANFSIDFKCLYPFGRDIIATDAMTPASGLTAASYATALTFAGNAPYQYPIITITYTAITGGTAKTVNVGNNANGQQVSITRTWATNDVLQVDVQNTKITINGLEIDPIGGFPLFPPGSQTMGYSDDFTTRTFNISVSHYAQWL